MSNIILSDFDIIIINSSAGKDSLCAIWEICRQADLQGYPRNRIHVSHQDLGRMEWKGTRELAERQADFFGLQFHVSRRRTQDGREENLLEHVRRRGKWPSNKQRYCTSDHKRGPGGRVVTALTRDLGPCRVLYVFGFRAEESPFRSKKDVMTFNEALSTRRREVWEYLPIHDWKMAQVWQVIRDNRLPYHPAYDLGMPRLSCVFCIFSPFDALVIAGRENPDLLDDYIQVEEEIGHTFQNEKPIRNVREAIAAGYEPKTIADWVM